MSRQTGVRFGLLITAIISIGCLLFYVSISNRYTDTFVVKNALHNVEAVENYLLTHLEPQVTTQKESIDFLQHELISCDRIESNNGNLEARFPNERYDMGYVCYVHLAARKFEHIDVLEVWLTQPKLRLVFIFYQEIFKDFAVEITRTGL